MKRYIAMLLVFLLMVPCMAQAELDLQLVPVDALLLNAGSDEPLVDIDRLLGIELLDDELLLIDYSGDDGRQRSLLHLSTEELIPLTLAENFKHANQFDQRIPKKVQLEVTPQRSSVRFVEGSQFVMCWRPDFIRVLDKTNGVIHSSNAPAGKDYLTGMTPANDIYIANGNEINVYALDGTVLYTLRLAEGEGQALNVLPFEGGFAILSAADVVLDGTLRCTPYYLTLTDAQLRVQSVQKLGSMPVTFPEYFHMYRLTDSCFLICSDAPGALALTDQTGIRYMMLLKDEKLAVVPYEDTPETLGAMLNARINLAGVSNDKSYALFILRSGGHEDLYSLDLRTFEITLQMTEDELAELSLDAYSRILWPGGEYLINDEERLFHIVERNGID